MESIGGKTGSFIKDRVDSVFLRKEREVWPGVIARSAGLLRLCSVRAALCRYCNGDRRNICMLFIQRWYRQNFLRSRNIAAR